MNPFRSMNQPGLRCLVVALLVVALRGADAAQARQGELPLSTDEALQPDFVRRDLALMQHDLKLDASQAAIVATLFRDYETAFRKGADAVRDHFNELYPAIGEENPVVEQQRENMRERISQLIEETRRLREQEGADPAQIRQQFEEKARQLREELRQTRSPAMNAEKIKQVLEKAGAQITAWLPEKARLRAQFIADVQAVLGKEQQEFWPPLERRFTREKTLPRGRLSGESADLVQLVGELLVPAEPAETIAPLLRDYELRLDQALQQRNDNLLASQLQMLTAMQSADRNAAQAVIQQQVQLRVAVRNVNDEFAEVLGSKLPADFAARLAQTYRQRAYGSVFRGSQAQRVLTAAKELPGLEPATLQSIDVLLRAYLEELAPANEQLLGLVRRHEPEQLQERALRRWAYSEDPESQADPENDPIRDAFSHRNELGRRYAQQLRGLLSAEQFQRLPGAEIMVPDSRGPVGQTEPVSPPEQHQTPGNGH